MGSKAKRTHYERASAGERGGPASDEPTADCALPARLHCMYALLGWTG